MSRILIVDDDTATTSWLSGVLANQGYKVEVATTGDEALYWLGCKHFDLVILDLMLPGKNGWEFVDEKNAGPHARVPVVVLSAWTRIEQPTPGVVAIIQKPAREEAILEVIRLALGEVS